MLVETAYKEYRESMVQAMIAFSRDEQAAQDGVSQAFMKALVHKQLLEDMPEPAMKAWLYAAARNAVVDIKRRESRFSRFSYEGAETEYADPQQSDWDNHVAVKDLLVRLPPGLQALVKLKYFDQMNATEIGQAMNLPPGTVRTRLRTAIQMMRNIF